MFLIFNPLLGEHFFRWGWNHQLVMDYSISHEMFGSFYLNQSGWLTEYHSKRSKLQCPHHFHMCWDQSNSQCLHREWPSTQIVGFIYPNHRVCIPTIPSPPAIWSWRFQAECTKKLKETWRKAEPSRRLGRNRLDWKKNELPSRCF